MRRTVGRAMLALTVVVALSGGCSQWRRPFKVVQLCLAGPEEVPAFIGFMNALAQAHAMEFTDRSGGTEAELRSLGDKNVSIAHPHVNIGADQGGEFGFGAGNLGLPSRQMAIGFNGRDPDAVSKFVSAAIAQISTRWRIYEVPPNRGALPLSVCE